MLHACILGILLAIDPLASKVQFTVAHIFVEHVTGTLPVQSGTIDLPDGTLVPAAVNATLDATKLTTGDRDRDGVLQTSDWFDTAKFPVWRFASTKIAATPAGFTMEGLLTIHGVTQPERLNVTIVGDATHPRYRATGTIDRHAFGMSTTRLDPVIGNPVQIALDISVAAAR